MPSSVSLTRRTFLKSTAAISAASFLPARSWARISGANDRLIMGVIGCGGMGRGHLGNLIERRDKDNIEVLRVCDVYRRRLNDSIRIIAPGLSGSPASAGTMDYREVLDDKNINTVLIATPDHWHNKIAIEAMEAGKDVYCEKPLSLSVEQALECRGTVHRTKRVLQVGVQGTSDDQYWKAREAIAAGRIGKVVWSQGSYCRNSREGQFNWHIDPNAGPRNPKDSDDYIDWDRWLGHEWGLAPKIEWNADHFFRFRKYWAYNGGVATDLLYHRLAPLLLAITGPNGEYPRKVVASGGKYIEKDNRDIPDTFLMMVDYPTEHTIVLASVMTNDENIDTVIRGRHGSMQFGSELTVREQSTWWKEFRDVNGSLFEHGMKADEKGEEKPDPTPAPGKACFTIAKAERRDHLGNFFDAIRNGAPLSCNVDLGASTMAAIKMAVESYRRDKAMLWDAKAEKMIE